MADPCNEYGETALHIATRAGLKMDVLLLLDDGMDPNARTHQGDTPLMLAALMGHPGIAALLIDHGAQVDAKDPEGRTAWMIARHAPNPDTAQGRARVAQVIEGARA